MKKLLRKILQIFYTIKIWCKFATCCNNKRIIMMATPTHGNLGDHAIVYAEKKILKNLLPEYSIIEIQNGEFNRCKNFVKKFIKSTDIIIIDGGGNLGTLWPWEDDKISDIISIFTQNKIIVFPQTIFYNPTEDNTDRLEKNKKIYSQAKNLTFLLRDKKSYEFFILNFPHINAVFCPDIVFSVKLNLKQKRKNKILLCFRSDKEKVVSNQILQNLKSYLTDLGFKLKNTDTVINKRVSNMNRNYELKKKWNEFSTSKLIITDRLHAMIFAYITNTPCIAINNISKKVEGSFYFIKNCEFIKLVNNINDVTELISQILACNDYNPNNFTYPIEILKDALKDETIIK